MSSTKHQHRLDEVIRLRRAGMAVVKISEKTGVPRSTIYRWLCNFAEENVPTMKESASTITTSSNTESNQVAPASESAAPDRGKSTSAPAANETPEEKIARLERALEEASLRADLYEEIINIAEKNFNIQIRKKAGTKQ